METKANPNSSLMLSRKISNFRLYLGVPVKRTLLAVPCLLLLCCSARAGINGGLAVGQVAPNFKADNYKGQPVALADYVKQGPAVLLFYRGGWCRYCRAQMQAYQEQLPAFTALGVSVVAVSVDTVPAAARFVEENNLGFEVVSDSSALTLDLYKVRYQVPLELADLYKEKYGIDLEQASGRTDRIIAVPATYVIDQQGKILYAYVNEDYRVRPAPEDIIEFIRKLGQDD